MAATKLSDEVKRQVSERVVAGQSNPEIKQFLLDEHGIEITDASLSHYRKLPAIVKAIADAQLAALEFGIAQRVYRMRALQERHFRCRRVIEARAKDMADVSGGESGLLVRTIKLIGKGEDAREVEEYRVDTPLLEEMRGIEEQAAREAGQWSEKHEHTGKNGGPIEMSGFEAAVGKIYGDESAEGGDAQSPRD